MPENRIFTIPGNPACRSLGKTDKFGIQKNRGKSRIWVVLSDCYLMDQKKQKRKNWCQRKHKEESRYWKKYGIGRNYNPSIHLNHTKGETIYQSTIYNLTFPQSQWKHSRIFNHIYTGLAQTVKRLPTMRETWVWSLGQEDSLEKERETHSSTLAWKMPWTEEPGRLQSMGSQRVGHD